MNRTTVTNRQWVVGTRIAAALLLVSVLCTIHARQASAADSADSAAYLLGGWAANEALSFNPFSLVTYPVRTVSYASGAAVATASAPLEGSAEETASTESSSPEIVKVTPTAATVLIPNAKPPKRSPGRPTWVPGPPPWHKTK